MTHKAHKQSKLIRFITLPIRVLSNARDFYVRSLTDYAGRVSYGSGMGSATEQFSLMPRRYSTSSSRANDGDDLRELIRAASARCLGDRIDVNMIVPKQKSEGLLPKSCSVGMGRIDEDKVCDFEENGGVCEKNDLIYSRSKSYAVMKRNVMF